MGAVLKHVLVLAAIIAVLVLLMPTNDWATAALIGLVGGLVPGLNIGYRFGRYLEKRMTTQTVKILPSSLPAKPITAQEMKAYFDDKRWEEDLNRQLASANPRPPKG